MTYRTPAALEEALYAIGRERYHAHHPFHRAMNEGRLSRGQVQAWALNRYVYQSAIPKKDAALIARTDDPELRRIWRSRLVDHDGTEERDGGIERWLRLAEALGLDREDVRSHRGVLPATRFAVDAYVRFVAERPLLEAIASSLTELFAPETIATRVSSMLAHYDFVSREALSYFEHRMEEAPRDAGFALGYVLRNATSEDAQEAVLSALRFKCDVLWAQLDALHHAYVEPGHPPPGAFRPSTKR